MESVVVPSEKKISLPCVALSLEHRELLELISVNEAS